MRPTDVVQTLNALIPTKRPLFLHGPPGCGKSSLVRQAAAKLEMEVCDIRAVLLDPVDLRGLPSINGDGKAHWCQPAFLPHDPEWSGVVFLDELPQAPPLVQSACLQLTLDRKIGEYELPPGATVIAAGNRAEDRAGAHRLISSLLNRFIHIDLDVDNDDFHSFAVEHGFAVEVRSFLKFRPSLLYQFDPASQKRAWPTPRSWQFVSDVLPFTPDIVLHSVVAGCVGEGPSAEFIAYLRTYKGLPDIDALLAKPGSFKPPSDPAILYALSGALAERARHGEAAVLQAIHAVSERLPQEYGVLTIRDSALINRKIIDEKVCPSARDFLKRNKNVLLAR